jgi:hypothetical protein
MRQLIHLSTISLASGYLCLESEGAPMEFRNILLRKLPAKD